MSFTVSFCEFVLMKLCMHNVQSIGIVICNVSLLKGYVVNPNSTFVEHMKCMYAMFNALHPKNGISQGTGLFKVTFEKFKAEYPQYEDKVLKCITSTFYFVRLRLINRLIATTKKEQPKSDRVLRSQKPNEPDEPNEPKDPEEPQMPGRRLTRRGIRKLGDLID